MFRNKDIGGGIILLVLGLAFATASSVLPFGTPLRMGPGFFPTTLSLLLIALGGLISFQGYRSEAVTFDAIHWRGTALPLLAVVTFAVSVRPLGLLPAMGLSVFLSTLASRSFVLTEALLCTVGITVLCWLIFIAGLELPMPLVGPWLGGY